jgi:diguanylate cyclase (GGDEF)-like protein
MKNCVRDVDTVARIGGDEFAVLLGQVESQLEPATATASVVAQKLRDALSAPYQLSVPGDTSEPAMIEHVCTASLGVALFFKDRLTSDQIIQAADAAMYRAKQAHAVQASPHFSCFMHPAWKRDGNEGCRG